MENEIGENGPAIPNEDRRVLRWGASASAAYIGAMLVYVIGTWPNILGLTMNEFGDFLAGVFSPVAFLWLVLGFLQQGHELRLQIVELRHSVDAQNDLVVATRDQRIAEAEIYRAQQEELERSTRPVLRLHNGGNGGVNTVGYCIYWVDLSNVGASCSDVRVTIDGEQIASKQKLDAGGSPLRLTITAELRDVCARHGKVEYLDSRGFRREQVFIIHLNNGDVTFSHHQPSLQGESAQ